MDVAEQDFGAGQAVWGACLIENLPGLPGIREGFGEVACSQRCPAQTAERGAFPPVVPSVPEGLRGWPSAVRLRLLHAFVLVDDAEFASAGSFPTQVAECVGLLGNARKSVEPLGGEVVAEFFDVGFSRSVPWDRRPEASRLLAELANPRRDWNAVVVGEGTRCWFGDQFSLIAPRFEAYGVDLWAPELGGHVGVGASACASAGAVGDGYAGGRRRPSPR
ncbi:recombinase family protein [Amycolatopsis sulphurea]|uniref:hypothetical protein n=1 Tax=Amycolatopsis sulphurea TaxID=76022 RepID=UPI001FEC1D5C|nr:hypothetical protein [Amycolatopsis sulphurea]